MDNKDEYTLDYYFKREKGLNTQKGSENYKTFKQCSSLMDYLIRGRHLILAGTKNNYFDAFISYEYAVRLDDKNFDARLGEYKAWYLYSLATNPTKWDPSIDDYYRNLIARTPNKYRKAVISMYETDKANYLTKVSRNGNH
ncbi:hypothetical protein IJ768_02595 [Candidatus Saccharibacteria bacterium]|nr:hypothetical protein [Candidatus Saccharibacteria bacterium]